MLSERLARFGAERRQSDHEVAGRVADARGAEVDDGAEPPAVDEQIALADITVEPHRLCPPPGRERGVPDVGHDSGVDRVAEGRDRAARLPVVDGR